MGVKSLVIDAKEVAKQVSRYAADAESISVDCIHKAKSLAEYRQTYSSSLFADTVLGGLATANLRPGFSAARSIVKRIPLLVAVGQGSIAKDELRRFLELALWNVYFSDHPIEWLSFLKQADGGFSRDQGKPISYAAHRELNWYLSYCQELMAEEPSGVAKAALDEIGSVKSTLNTGVHAAHLVKGRSAAHRAPYDEVSVKELASFNNLQGQVLGCSCIVLAAWNTKKFNRFTAVQRACFDKLIKPVLRRRIRQGPFGLA